VTNNHYILPLIGRRTAMRTDATIDRQGVICRNADRTGYGKFTAQVGDILWWRINGEGNTSVGRVVGRIAYAPALDGDREPIKSYILVGRLSSDMTYVSEAWINPADVWKVEEPRHQLDTMKWFLSDTIVKEDIGMVRRCLSELWSTWDKFMDYINKGKV